MNAFNKTDNRYHQRFAMNTVLPAETMLSHQQSINPSINQSISQSVNQSINQSINQRRSFEHDIMRFEHSGEYVFMEGKHDYTLGL